METTSSPSLPFTSDPALLNDWDESRYNAFILPSSTFSDDIKAQELLHEESIVEKSRRGEVIQHRSWKLTEVFRSDLDYLQESPVQSRTIRSPFGIPSSPPISTMPAIISSPVAYPPSSSPPVTKRALPSFVGRKQKDGEAGDGEERAAKRRMLDNHGLASILEKESSVEAIKQKESRTIGGFIDVESEDEGLLPNAEKDFRAPLVGSRSINQAVVEKSTRKRPGGSMLFSHFGDRREILTCSGKAVNIRPRKKVDPLSFEEMVSARSTTKSGRAKKSYYGIDIQQLVNDAEKESISKPKVAKSTEATVHQSVEASIGKSKKTSMWTEKYRAKRFFDLVGDDRTHREVLRWLKSWDPIVFPRSGKAKPTVSRRPDGEPDERAHRKILMLTGPPGLGKTTLAHVCASQAGYEIMEINASDERSSNVVKGRIRTSVGTESVKNVGSSAKTGSAKTARPVCVVIDEVDGVVTGSGGSGEGGFIKALIDLIQLDAKNAADNTAASAYSTKKKKKVDNFRLLRPIIMICNDVYHPSLRPLRQSSFAEVIHIRKPPLEAVVNRMKLVFEKENVLADSDAIRKLCEATWGMSSGPEARFEASGTGEGDIRSVLVVGEWAAAKLKSSPEAQPRMTRKWVEEHMLGNLSHSGSGTRGVGRGGAKEVVSRVFVTGAGFPKTTAAPLETKSKDKASTAIGDDGPRTQLHASELVKRLGMERLRELVDTSGETDRIVSDIFTSYPSHSFNDDTLLSKPNAAYEWLHFSDLLSSRVFSEQDWELMPYLSQPVLACHHIFASPARHFHSFEKKRFGAEVEEEVEAPFSGPRADYDAKEAEKASRAVLSELQASLNPALLRAFRSPEDISTDLLPYLIRMLSPDVKPVVVGGSGDARGVASVRKERERQMVRRAVEVMGGVGVKYERGKLEADFNSRGQTQWVYRMEPPLDTLSHFPTSTANTTAFSAAPTRYAVRQVLDQEYSKHLIELENAARQARFAAGAIGDDEAAYVFGNSVYTSGNKSNVSGPKSKTQGRNLTTELNVEALLNAETNVKRDFFGRVLRDVDGNVPGGNGSGSRADEEGKASGGRGKRVGEGKKKVWVTFHEGFSNAVRKPLTVEEVLRGL